MVGINIILGAFSSLSMVFLGASTPSCSLVKYTVLYIPYSVCIKCTMYIYARLYAFVGWLNALNISIIQSMKIRIKITINVKLYLFSWYLRLHLPHSLILPHMIPPCHASRRLFFIYLCFRALAKHRIQFSSTAH